MAYHLQISMQEVHQSKAVIRNLTEGHTDLVSRFVALEDKFNRLKKDVDSRAQVEKQASASRVPHWTADTHSQGLDVSHEGRVMVGRSDTCRANSLNSVRLSKDVDELKDHVRCQERQLASVNR